MQVKKKKEEEYKKAANMMNHILSRNLNNFGNKLKSRVAQHMINSHVFSQG